MKIRSKVSYVVSDCRALFTSMYFFWATFAKSFTWKGFTFLLIDPTLIKENSNVELLKYLKKKVREFSFPQNLFILIEGKVVRDHSIST